MVEFSCFAYLGTNGDDFVWNFFFIAFLFIYSVCLCLFMWGVLTAVLMWESEDDLLESTVSFYHLGAGYQTRIVSLVADIFTF